MNTIYIHDAGSGKLIIRKIPDTVLGQEEALRVYAETNGMQLTDCEWGSIGEISIQL
jgi:hypothetical protein